MLTVRPVKSNEIERAVELALYEKNLPRQDLADRRDSFLTTARQEGYDLSRAMVVDAGGNLLYSCLFISNPGRTGFAISAIPTQGDTQNYQQAVTALRELYQWAIRDRCVLVQMLIDPDDTDRAKLFLDSGARHMTGLAYFSRLSRQGDELFLKKKSDAGKSQWLPYNDQRHELFKQVIQKTYRDSQDCPELEGLRDMEDVIASHKSAGQFDRRYWNLLLWNDSQEENACGVLLLTPLKNSHSMELVYMGLTPQARGKGLGNILLSKALEIAHGSVAQSIILAVDVRNQKASQLYQKFGFQLVLHRNVYYYVQPSTDPFA